jgi:hypothetical protein
MGMLSLPPCSPSLISLHPISHNIKCQLPLFTQSTHQLPTHIAFTHLAVRSSQNSAHNLYLIWYDVVLTRPPTQLSQLPLYSFPLHHYDYYSQSAATVHLCFTSWPITSPRHHLTLHNSPILHSSHPFLYLPQSAPFSSLHSCTAHPLTTH